MSEQQKKLNNCFLVQQTTRTPGVLRPNMDNVFIYVYRIRGMSSSEISPRASTKVRV